MKFKPNLHGWIRDKKDPRDLMLKKKFVCMPTIVPEQVDLRQWCSPVEQQEELGSCTANALVGALEFLEIKEKGEYTDLSRLFVYYNERVIEGTVLEDAGAQIRDGIKALKRWGVAPHVLWPYEVDSFMDRPSKAAFEEAKKHRIQSYFRIFTLNDMKTALATGFPFVFGFVVFSGFMTETVMRTGIGQMPHENEDIEGGHAVLAVGYDNKEQRFLVRNSWGTEWGQKGYFTLPYEFVGEPEFCDDFWVIDRSA